MARLVAEWGASMNLTGHRGPEAVMTGLIVDAIALEAEVARIAAFTTVADLGSGAGFPGIPFAILDPRRSVRLVDSRERRHHFQRAVKRQIGAANLIPIRGRLEALDAVPSDLAICQALARPARAVELALPWTRPGGLIVVPGSDQVPDPGSQPGIDQQGVARYAVPGGRSRTLWWGRRAAAPRSGGSA